MKNLAAAFRELLLLQRLARATLCARYCAWAIQLAREDLHRAILTADEARAELHALEHDRRPGIPTWLRRA